MTTFASRMNKTKITCFSLLIVACLLSGSLYGADLVLREKAGDYDAEIKFDRAAPIIGENRIDILLKDTRGTVIKDARVLVNYYMPPMPRMAPMNYRTDAKSAGDAYRATMRLIMAGPWVIAVKVTRADKTKTVKFHIDVK
jgi:hypothetical protein